MFRPRKILFLKKKKKISCTFLIGRTLSVITAFDAYTGWRKQMCLVIFIKQKFNSKELSWFIVYIFFSGRTTKILPSLHQWLSGFLLSGQGGFTLPTPLVFRTLKKKTFFMRVFPKGSRQKIQLMAGPLSQGRNGPAIKKRRTFCINGKKNHVRY